MIPTDGTADPTPAPPVRDGTSLFRNLVRNLAGAVGLVLPLPTERRMFHFDLDQLFTLLILSFGVEILCARAPHAAFWPSGLASLCAVDMATLVACYCVVRSERAPRTLPALVILLLSVSIVLRILRRLASLLMTGYGFDFRTGHSLPVTAIDLLFLGWFGVAAIRSVSLLYRRRLWHATLMGLIPLIGVALPVFAGLNQPVWRMPPPRVAATARPINAERVFEAQAGLIQAAIDRLAPHRPGESDLYFVGFAGWAEQDVFLKEGRFAQHLFDDKFATGGRSILLANNRATTSELPLASVANLGDVLDRLRTKMDVDTDVLFLLLTSHGSPDEVAIRFDGLGLLGLDAETLREMLDRAAIKWRVIVISACYSGSFIEALKDDHTLVMTAARADRTSFGCSDENDFTYFGEAYFGRALQRTYSFIGAFDQARASIAAREIQEQLTPSEPQIFIGDAIRPKLDEIEVRLSHGTEPGSDMR